MSAGVTADKIIEKKAATTAKSNRPGAKEASNMEFLQYNTILTKLQAEKEHAMDKFDFGMMNVSLKDNGALVALSELLWEQTSSRGEDEEKIDQEYDGILSTLTESFNPKQRKWFDRYQQQMEEELALAEKKRYNCGFKTAMMLAQESMR